MSLKSFTWMLVFLGLSGLGMAQIIKRPVRITPTVQSVMIAQTSTQYVVPTIQPTETPIPSATIDYQQTANVAQSTADEARRINAQATAQHEAIVMENVRLTAAQDQREFEIIMLTATMVGTSIPLTQTQQAVANTQTAKQQAILSGQLTSTKEAPTQAYAFIAAENARRYGAMEHIGQIVATWAVVIFVVIFVTWLYYRWNQEERRLQLDELTRLIEEDPEPPKETVLHMRTDKGGGDFSQTRFVIPCTPEQLTEFAEAITQGKKTMAINQWEGKETLFTRPVMLRLRAWLRQERETPFVVVTEDNQLAPTNDFLDFLCRWLDNQKLPVEYEFMQENYSPTVKNGMISHEYESFDRISA